MLLDLRSPCPASRRRRRLVAALVAFAVAASATIHAAADDDPRDLARRHFSRALELVDEGALETAVVEFRRAYDLRPSYSVLFNIGQAYVALGKPVEAVDALERFLAEGDANVPAARRAQVTAEIQRQRARVGVLDVRTTPPGAVVRVDGRELGTTPLAEALRVSVGTHTVAVSLDGHDPVERTTQIAGEERQTLDIALRPHPSAAPGVVVTECVVPEIEVVLDGRPAGQVSGEPLTTTAGPHVLELRRSGYVTARLEPLVLAGTVTHVACAMDALDPLPPELSGRLSIVASEPGVTFEIDGRASAPSAVVPYGRHALVARMAGFETWQRTVTVTAGRTILVDARLVPGARLAMDHVRRAESRRGWALALGAGGVAILAGGSTLLAVNDQRAADVRASQQSLAQLWALGRTPSGDLAQRQDAVDGAARSVQTTDWIAMIVAGAAFVAAGAVLWFTGDDPVKYERAAAKGE